MSQRGLSDLRKKVLAKSTELYGCFLLVGKLTRELQEEYRSNEEAIKAEQSKKWLHKHLDNLATSITEVRRTFGIVASEAQITELLNIVTAEKEGYLLQIAKWQFEKLLDVSTLAHNTEDWPQHASIEVSVRRNPDVFEVFVLEAALFEDLCALFNLLHERKRWTDPEVHSKRAIKTRRGLVAAVVSSAFYVLEAYLNGLAFDFLMSGGRKTESQQKIDLLTEWDSKASRRRYVAFRDKLIQYPKIAAGKTHPDLNEGNCPEMKLILETAKGTRDAIVHASPFPPEIAEETVAPETFERTKQEILMTLPLVDVERIVDAVISLIRKIEMSVRGNTNRVFWLVNRTESGRFPDDAFS